MAIEGAGGVEEKLGDIDAALAECPVGTVRGDPVGPQDPGADAGETGCSPFRDVNGFRGATVGEGQGHYNIADLTVRRAMEAGSNRRRGLAEDEVDERIPVTRYTRVPEKAVLLAAEAVNRDLTARQLVLILAGLVGRAREARVPVLDPPAQVEFAGPRYAEEGG